MKMNCRTSILMTLVALTVTGCYTPDGRPDRTASGALMGGAIGATSGALIGHRPGAALLGGAIGAIAGGLIGHSLDADARERLRAQAPQTYTRIDQGQPLGVADIKAMAQSGVSDEVIISQIRATHSAYRLSAADIIDLNNSRVSQKVIEFMINASGAGASQGQAQPAYVMQPPPPPQVETIYVSPSPGYMWVGGEWEWHGRWVWVGGHWMYPPRPGVVWVSTVWISDGSGYRCHHGHWR